MNNIETIIKQLDLAPHPEGGYFKETYRSVGMVDKHHLPSIYAGNRNYATCIYFLLTSSTFSAFHKINQDEIWHFYDGSPIELHTLSMGGAHSQHVIGKDFSKGQVPQLVVPGNHWFAAQVLAEDAYSLVGCTVAPGFDFDDFTLAERKALTEAFPNHKELIDRFTRD